MIIDQSTDVNAYDMLSTRREATVPGTEAGRCGAVPSGRALGADVAADVARRFRALGDPTRVRLVSLIAAQPAGEACICDLTDTVGLSQPTVSHHMRQLVEAGLVSRDQRGRWAYYAVLPAALDLLDEAMRPSVPDR